MSEGMGYEIWDRFDRQLIYDFDTAEEALVFLHDAVRSLTFDAAAQMLHRFQLTEVSDDGTTTRVLLAG